MFLLALVLLVGSNQRRGPAVIRKFLTIAAMALARLWRRRRPIRWPRTSLAPRPGPTGGARPPSAFIPRAASRRGPAARIRPTWQAMRLSRKRNWGHPEMVGFLIGLSQAARQAGWQGPYIGDMSQPRGGPMVSGHASHQMGLDADIWLLPPKPATQPGAARKISSVSVVNRAARRLRAVEPATWRSSAPPPAIRGRADLCRSGRQGRHVRRRGAATALAAQGRPIANHDYHFSTSGWAARRVRSVSNRTRRRRDGCDEAAEWIKNRIDPSRVKPVPLTRTIATPHLPPQRDAPPMSGRRHRKIARVGPEPGTDLAIAGLPLPSRCWSGLPVALRWPSPAPCHTPPITCRHLCLVDG